MKIYDTNGNLVPEITSAVEEPPTANSLQDILHKDTNYTYDNTTDALEALRDRIDALNTADQSDLDAILANLATLDGVADTTLANVVSILTDYLAHGTWGLTAIRAALQLVQTDADNIDANVLSAINDYLGHGTWGLAEIRSALQLVQTDADNIDANVLAILQDYLQQMKSNLCRWGQISAIDGNTFTSAALAGMGIDAMPAGWYVYVMQADDATPEGEYRLITDYTNDGVVSHEAFSVALEVGDRVQLLHPSIGMLGQVDTSAAEGAVTTTDFMMAYVKQLVTELIVVDGIVDNILTDTETTIPGTISTMQGNVTDILTDTETTIPGTISTMQGNVTDILTDTETTIPGTITTLQGNVTTILSRITAAVALASSLTTHDTEIKALVDSKVMGRLQVVTATWDLLRGGAGAGTDVLFTGNTQAVILESLVVRMPTTPDVTDTDPITSLAIATDDAEPGIIIPATSAPVASMTPEAQFGWTGTLYIPVDTEIEGTIAGGDADAECLVIVTATYRAVVSGGYLS